MLDQEQRKQYNKDYYEKNKDKIHEYLYKKTECQFCKRQVARNNILRHYETKLCHRQRQLLINIENHKKQML